MPQQLERRVAEQVLYVAPRSGEEIIYAENFTLIRQEPLAQMRSQEAGARVIITRCFRE